MEQHKQRTLNRSTTVTALALLSLVGGCATMKKAVTVDPPPSNEPAPSPLVIDEAMQIRDWDRSTAEYANGDVVAPAKRTPFRFGATDNNFVDAGLSFVAYLGNVFVVPLSYAVQPPGTTETSTGVQYEPTYTAAPPLPPVGPPTPRPDTAGDPIPADASEPPTDTGPAGGAPSSHSGPPSIGPRGTPAGPSTPAPEAPIVTEPAPAPSPAPERAGEPAAPDGSK